MGHGGVTVQKLEVVQVEPEKSLIYLHGAVPGPRGGLVTISETVKTKKARVEVSRPALKKDKMGNIIGKKPTKAAQK